MKKKLITIRIAEDKHAEFKVAADAIGASMSTLLHQYIVKVIGEQRRQHPEAFAHLDAGKKSKPSSPKIIRRTARKRDTIDAAIDAALAFTGKPPSEADRQKIREILEREQDADLEKSP